MRLRKGLYVFPVSFVAACLFVKLAYCGSAFRSFYHTIEDRPDVSSRRAEVHSLALARFENSPCRLRGNAMGYETFLTRCSRERCFSVISSLRPKAASWASSCWIACSRSCLWP